MAIDDLARQSHRLTIDRLALGISNCRSVTSVPKEIALAESLDIRSAFIAEDIGCHDAFQLAATAASRTSKITMTIGVANPYTRSPYALAQSYLTLSELSGGRARLGLGSSSRGVIEGQLGLTYGHPLEVMRRAVQRIRADLDASAPEREMPLLLAAMGPRMLRLAGMLADGVLLNTGAGPDYIRWAVAIVRSGAAEAGRRPEEVSIAVWVPVYLGDDREAALERARRWAAGMLSIPAQGELLLEKAGIDSSILPEIRRLYQAYPHTGDLSAAARLLQDDITTRLAIVGDVSFAMSRLEDYVEAGADTLVVGPGPVKKMAQVLSGANGRGSS